MSMLRDYMAQYGSRLQSILGEQSPGITPDGSLPNEGGAQTFPLGSNPAPAMNWEPMSKAAPTSELAAEQPMQDGDDFRSHWQRTPPEQRKKQVDALEQAVGSIDKAYDEMIAQLGQRPSGKLSREDKGMLLMEFGLAMMANSRPGVTAVESAGAAGSQALGTYREMTRGRQREHDANVRAINTQRAKSKSELATKLATEQMKADTARQKAESELGRVAGTVTAEGGDVYTYTRGGKASALLDPDTGEPIRGRERPSEPLVPVLDENGVEIWVPRSEAAGMRKRPPASSSASALGGLKASDSNAIYRQAAALFGGTFDPLTGRISGLSREQTQTVQQIAANAGELFLGGEKNHAKAVNDAFAALRDGRASPSSSSGPRTFKNEAEVGEAFQRGDIKKGDVVVVNGQQFKVQ